MSVYYYDNSGLVEGLPGFEGRTTLKSLPLHRNYGPCTPGL